MFATTLRCASRSLQQHCALRPTLVLATRAFSSSFSMADLKTLRHQSGAPIVECKKALQETNSDLNAAMDWLRQHGAAKAATKVQGNETTEGLVGLCIADTTNDKKQTAALVQVAAETDFAGRSETFVQLVQNVAQAVLQQPEETTDDNNATIQTLLDEAIVAIRENLAVPHTTHWSVDPSASKLVGYIHNRVPGSDAGSAAALVQVAAASNANTVDDATLEAVGKKLAMHIVAARPQYLTPDEVPDDVVQKETDVLTAQIQDSGKPAEIVEKIVQGRLQKFYQSICLTEQAHMIEESNPKVAKVLQDSGVVVERFACYSIA